VIKQPTTPRMNFPILLPFIPYNHVLRCHYRRVKAVSTF
jgi:hypothetical protein